jgi:hypothetical protein
VQFEKQILRSAHKQGAALTLSHPYGWFQIFARSKYRPTFNPTGDLQTTEAAMAQGKTFDERRNDHNEILG